MQPNVTRVRLTELDGLRGWAALSVLLFHMYWECFGILFPDIRSIWVAGALNGKFAVALFFVISGAALGAPFFAGAGHRYLAASAVKRYVRLSLPIASFTMLFFVMAQTGLVMSHDAAKILQAEDWAGLTSNPSPSLVDTLMFMTRYVYTGAEGAHNIMPFLWTMPIEMLGSMLLFLMLALIGQFPDQMRGFRIMTGLLFLVSPELGAFFLGAFLTRYRLTGQRWAFFEDNRRPLTLLTLGVVVLTATGTHVLSMPAVFKSAANVLVAVALIFVIMHSPSLRRIFGENRLSLFLGQISFTLYILHYIVITTLLSFLVICFEDMLTLPMALGIATVCSIVAIAASWLLMPVDRASHRLSRRFSDWVLLHPQPRRVSTQMTGKMTDLTE